MKTSFEEATRQLDNLVDKIIENIINAPDEEILDEVEEEYGDRYYESKEFKKILKKAKNKVKEAYEGILRKHKYNIIKKVITPPWVFHIATEIDKRAIEYLCKVADYTFEKKRFNKTSFKR